MRRKSFTLMEVLITVTIITVLAAGVIILINPVTTIQRGVDSARKKNLDDAKKMLEEYVTDTGCYPQPTQICSDTPSPSDSTCHICTKGQASPFSYFTKDICDPKHGGTKDYLYQPETIYQAKDVPHGIPASGFIPATCPKWFRIYSVLDSPYNAADDVWGCKKGGCGVPPVYGYSYLVASPGAPNDDSATSNWWCHVQIDDKCHQCTPYETCIGDKTNDCYGKQLYASCKNCCADHSSSCPFCK